MSTSTSCSWSASAPRTPASSSSTDAASRSSASSISPASTNPETQGLGLDPELIPLWLAHEIAHAVRYTSPDEPQRDARLIDDAGGYYSYWEPAAGVAREL